ncbi:MAG: ATP-binding protein [Candidatus Helarchaeota archaeon]
MSNELKNRDAYINIANKLSVIRQGVPKDKNGNPSETYLKYLSLMYNPEEAQIIQHLEVFPNTTRLSKFAKKLEKNKDELKEMLDRLAERGFIQKLGSSYAIPNPLFIYDAPFILKINYEDNIETTIEQAKLSREFFEKEGYYKSWETSIKGTPRSRILTVSEKVESPKTISPVEEIYSIIDMNNSFAVVPCPCRMRAELEGIRKCKEIYPIHNCILIGPMAEGILDMGDPVVKKATKEEVIEIVKTASEIGLVHTTDNYAGQTNIICSCCECCCSLLAGLTRPGLNNPRAIAKANFIAIIDQDQCLACETCVERCKFGALSVEDIAIVDAEKCMGCGLCAVICPNDAILMKRLERERLPGLN